MSKITSLPLAAPLTGGETIPLVQAAQTRRVNAADYMAYLATGAQLARDQAADLVLPQNIFIDVALATAEAAVAVDTVFKLVSTVTNLCDVRKRTGGGSTLLYQEATSAALASAAGSGLIGHNEGLAGVPAWFLHNILRKLALTPEQALAPGESIAVDAGPAIRRIWAAGRPVRLSSTTYTVAPDPASAFLDGGVTRFGHCITMPSNAVLFCEPGSQIKGANGLQSWTRIFTAINVSGFRIVGTLATDGNVANKGAAHNDQMHGFMLFNATNFQIDAIDSRNTRGDNIYIGGDDDTRGTADGLIGKIVCRVAGRKSLAVQASDNVVIQHYDLDNAGGGIGCYMPAPAIGQSIPSSAGVYASDTGFPMLNTTAAAIVLAGTTQASLLGQGFVVDKTDGHTLDLEPDSFSGAVRNSITLQSGRARGSGVDFTAGTSAAAGDAWRANIGVLDLVIVPRPGVLPWEQNAITLNIGDLSISGITAATAGSTIAYAARLNVDRMKINGASPAAGDFAFLVAQVGGNVPRVRIGLLEGAVAGSGFEVREGDLEVGHSRFTCSNISFWVRGLSGLANVQTRARIKLLDLEDAGDPLLANYAVLFQKGGGNMPLLDIDAIRYRDTRATKLARIIYVGVGASAGLRIGSVENETPVPTCAWDGPDRFYRMGGGGTHPAQFICQGTPEGMITAPIGSIALRLDGGAGTALNAKESGVGNAGWVGK